MRKVMCTIQEGQISKPQIHDLEAMIKRIYRDRINSEQSLLGVPGNWNMEGGRVLPEPGAEDEWLDRTEQA